MRHQSFKRVGGILVVLGSITLACSSGTSSPPDTTQGGATAGATSTGGSPPATGGSGGTTGPAGGSGGSGDGGSTSTGGNTGGGGDKTGGTGGTATGGKAGSGAGGKAGSGGGGTPATGGSGGATGGTPVVTGGKAGGGGTPATGGTAGTGQAGAGGSAGTGGRDAGAPDTGSTPDTGAAGTPGSTDAVKSAGCGATTWPKSGTYTINVPASNPANRSYILRIPDNYDPNHPYRFIISYHCLNGTAKGVANGSNGTNYEYYGLWKLSQGSTIFVAPEGLPAMGSGLGWSNTNGQDIAFSRALVKEIESKFCVDTTRIFAEGFSMGGSMSYAVACAMNDIVRGVAVHSGGPMSGCDKSSRKPVAYFMTHGTKDSVCTYPGYGVPQLQDFAGVNGCTDAKSLTMPTPTDSSGMTPSCFQYTGCSAGHPTGGCLFVGDHTPSPGGEAKTWVPQKTWDFIKQF